MSPLILWTVLPHPFTESLSVPIHGWRLMAHRDTAFMSLSLDCIGTLSIRIMETAFHCRWTLLRKVWAFVVLTHVSHFDEACLRSRHPQLLMDLFPVRIQDVQRLPSEILRIRISTSRIKNSDNLHQIMNLSFRQLFPAHHYYPSSSLLRDSSISFRPPISSSSSTIFSRMAL